MFFRNKHCDSNEVRKHLLGRSPYCITENTIENRYLGGKDMKLSFKKIHGKLYVRVYNNTRASPIIIREYLDRYKLLDFRNCKIAQKS